MSVEFISIYEKKPGECGWYATLHCWEIQEGFFAGGSFWDGIEFTNRSNVTHWTPGSFDSEKEAKAWASENDPHL